MVAQTMAKQLVSVVNTSIWEVALPDIAEETTNGIGRLNMPMHGGRELVKRQEVFFILRQASHGLGRAFALFGFEGG